MTTSLDRPGAVAPVGPAAVSAVSAVSGDGTNRLTGAPIQPILVPLWYGCERPGTDLAPALIDAELRSRWQQREDHALSARLRDAVTVPVPVVPSAQTRVNQRDMVFLPAIAETTAHLADAVEAAIAEGALALTLGGDHALGVGSISGAARAVRRMDANGRAGRLGVIWIDTHADLNTPATSPSGHIHGLPLASAMGFGPAELTRLAGDRPAIGPADVCLLGVRDLDAGERRLIREHGIWTRTMEEWDDGGIRDGVLAAIAYLRECGVTAVHLSFDVDVIDPVDLPATGTICPGGLTTREAARVLRMIRDADLPIVAADVVELDPTKDHTEHDGLYLWTTTTLLATLLGETQR